MEPGRSYRGADATQRRDERRRRLVAAAIEVFGTEGYRNATVAKICASAGLTKRYFYESFNSSEDLLLAAYDHAVALLLDSVRTGAETGTDPDTRIRGAITGLFTRIADDPRMARLVLLEIIGISERVDQRYRDATRQFVETLLVGAQAATQWTPPPGAHPRVVATGLVGAVLMIAQQWLLTPHPQPIETSVASAHAIVAAMFAYTAP